MNSIRRGEKIDKALDIDVKTSKRHEGIECIVLMRDKPLCDTIHSNPTPMVGVPKRSLEDFGGNGEHRHVLNVRVMLQRVADDVMRVVVAFPPAEGEPH